MTVASAAWRRAVALAGAAVLIALLALAVRRLDLGRVALELRGADVRWLVAACMGFLSILPLWALEWRLLSPRTPLRTLPRMLGVVAMTSSVLNTAPMLLGEAAGVALLVTRIGISRAGALSVLAMDQLFVGLAKAAVIGGAIAVLPSSSWLSAAAPAFATGVALLLIVLVAAARPRHRPVANGRVASVLHALSEGLRPLRSFPLSASVLLLALAKKGVELVAIVCVQRAFGLVLPLDAALLVLAALAVATLLPLLPSNVGVYEAAVVLAYAHAGVSAERALAMGIVQHALFFACLGLPGYPALIVTGATRSAAAAR